MKSAEAVKCSVMSRINLGHAQRRTQEPCPDILEEFDMSEFESLPLARMEKSPGIWVAHNPAHRGDAGDVAAVDIFNSRVWWMRLPKGRIEPTGSIDLTELDSEIERAASAAEPHDAIQRLEAILERVEDSSAHAEARVRRLARKLPKPALAADDPPWLPEAITELKTTEGLSALQEPALGTTALLIRHFMSLPGTASLDAPTLSVSASHAIEVEWGSRLAWLVYPAQLTWPAVHVRVYGSHNGEAGGARSFWYARSVAEHSARLLDC